MDRFRGPCGIWPLPEPTGLPAAKGVPQTFTSAEGRFRISLPDIGFIEANQERKDFRWLVLNHGTYNVSYFDGVGVIDTPEVSETTLNKVRDSIWSKRPNSQLEADSAISLSGHPGREIRIRDKSGIQIDRIYLAGNRMYIVTVFVPKSLDCKVGAAAKVLDTFEITE